jgi:hypothetical protein
MKPEELTDEQLLEKIDDCSLDPVFFTHETMLRLTWILIKKYGFQIAFYKNKEIKSKYFKNAMKSDKFNATLTNAYTEILYHFMQNSSTNNFEKLLREFPRLKFNFKNLVKTHYGYDIMKEHRAESSETKIPILFTF